MTPREELEALRRIAELEAKDSGGSYAGAQPQNSAPSAVAQPAEAPEESIGDSLKRYGKEALGGAEYGLQRASAGLT